MIRIFLGIIIGIAILAGFVYFGGSKYLKTFGAKTEQAGERMEGYEKTLKTTAKDAKQTVEKTIDTTKEKVRGVVSK